MPLDHCPFDAACQLPALHTGPCQPADAQITRTLYVVYRLTTDDRRLANGRYPTLVTAQIAARALARRVDWHGTRALVIVREQTIRQDVQRLIQGQV